MPSCGGPSIREPPSVCGRPLAPGPLSRSRMQGARGSCRAVSSNGMTEAITSSLHGAAGFDVTNRRAYDILGEAWTGALKRIAPGNTT